MKKIALPLVLMAVLVLMTSCLNSVKNKIYQKESNLSHTMEFVGPNTVIINNGGPARVGVYRKVKDLLIVTESGTTKTYRILENSRVLVEEGSGATRWIKL